MNRLFLMLRLTVKDGERAFLMRNGRFEQVLGPGRHKLFDPLLDLMLTGIRTDEAARRERFADLMVEVRRTRDAAAAIAGCPLHSITGKKKVKVSDNISAHKLKAYFYQTLKLPVRVKRGTGKQTADETAVRALMLKHPAKIGALGEQVLLHRRAKKVSEFLSDTRIDADGRMRSAYGFSPESGRLSSSKNPKRGGCLPGNTEVLTRTGWRRLDGLTKRTDIAQWQPDGTILFLPADPVMTQWRGELCVASSWFHRATYTVDHRIPVAGVGRNGMLGGITTRIDKSLLVQSARDAARRA